MNKKWMKKLITCVSVCVLFSMLLTACQQEKEPSTPATSGAPSNTVTNPSDIMEQMEHDLRFDSNGEFKLVIFSDLRLSASVDQDVIENIERVLDQENPSLVLLGGDIHDGSIKDEAGLRTILDAVNAPMEEREIPWCHTFGVDAEGTEDSKTGYSKEDQMKVYQSYPYCTSFTSVSEVYGVSNYVLPIRLADSEKVGFNVWCLDANGYLNDYVPGLEDEVLLKKNLSGGTNLDCIHFSQLLWYWNTSVAFQEQNEGTKVPGIMYFQVPPYQFRYIFRNKDVTSMTGSSLEKLSAPERDSGVVWTCYERGDIEGIFCGYDASNDYAGTYLKMLLACCSSVGTTGDEKTAGARVVHITKNGGNMESYMAYLSN